MGTNKFVWIVKTATTPVNEITGSIIDSTNITNKTTNTYSANIIDQKLSNTGTSESVIQDIIRRTLDAAHPIGSYYWSDDPTDPSELFGGTWERVKDKFLYALGDEGNAGDEGGEKTHTLTVNEMPSHTHTQNAHNHTYTAQSRWGSNGASSPLAAWSVGDSNRGNATGTMSSTTATNQNTGGGAAHNNMPPYLKAYCWKRIDPNAGSGGGEPDVGPVVPG